MKLRTKLAALATTTVALMASAAAPGAHAITGGDADGNQHPNVGLIAFYDSEGRFRCTATLVSPTVLLTAAHCTTGTLGDTIVTFDSAIADAPPSPLPRAVDDAGTGTSKAGYDYDGMFTWQGHTYYSGTASTHPAYSDFTDKANWNDVGVVVLDAPVTGIAPAEIAPVGTLDAIPRSQLAHTLFRIVGYGTEVRKPDSGMQKPTPQSYPLYRRYADAPGQKLTPQILQVNGNINDTRGTGGSCFGDSGGPTFYPAGSADEKVVTVTSYGYTKNCRYLDGLQRVDIPVVADWLATFGVVAKS